VRPVRGCLCSRTGRCPDRHVRGADHSSRHGQAREHPVSHARMPPHQVGGVEPTFQNLGPIPEDRLGFLVEKEPAAAEAVPVTVRSAVVDHAAQDWPTAGPGDEPAQEHQTRHPPEQILGRGQRSVGRNTDPTRDPRIISPHFRETTIAERVRVGRSNAPRRRTRCSALALPEPEGPPAATAPASGPSPHGAQRSAPSSGAPCATCSRGTRSHLARPSALDPPPVSPSAQLVHGRVLASWREIQPVSQVPQSAVDDEPGWLQFAA